MRHATDGGSGSDTTFKNDVFIAERQREPNETKKN